MDRCSDCHREIPSHVERWYEVMGWERPRAKGGTNHLAERKRTGAVRCTTCMTKAQAGVFPGQTEMKV